jgi:pullulanase/glycogen debranching enzyme
MSAAEKHARRKELSRALYGSIETSAPKAPVTKVAPGELPGMHPQVDKLGAFFSPSEGKTVFRLFTPRATAVKLFLYSDKEAGTVTGTEDMTRLPDGTWEVKVDGNIAGTFYNFSVDGPNGPGDAFDPDMLVSDPYALANVNHNGPSIVVDHSRFDWGNSKFKRLPIEDIVNYEMHVRDYTVHPSSGVPVRIAGTYDGLSATANKNVGVGHLKELGVNAVELLPVHEYDNGASPTGTNHWGYMTSHYMSPECYYASDDDGSAVNELKNLVKTFHEQGIAVILDVVYNHTTEGNEHGPVLSFKGIDNILYYRLTPDHYYWNGTGCGNEFDTQNEAVRRLIIDSLQMWVEDYHIDGFRFDLAAGIDKETLLAIDRELPKDVYLISEPWTADWNRKFWNKGDLGGTRWSNWNDGYKHTVRDFIKGNGDRNNLMTVMSGSCFWWAQSPHETTNFIECHDNDTLMDTVGGDRKKARLGATVLLTSQGIPMLHEGMEFAKDKGGNANSYDQDNETNWINWDVKKKNISEFNFWKGLIAIRNKYSQFRHRSPIGGNEVEWIKPANDKTLGIVLKGNEEIRVLLNGHLSAWQKFDLPSGTWKILSDGTQADVEGLRTAQGDYNVPPLTGVILVKE